MKELFCDDPTYVYATLVVIEIILVCLWFARKNLIASLLLIVPIVAGVGVWGIDKLVVTDREMIAQMTEEMAAEAPKGNIRPLFDALDPIYYGFGEARDAVIQLAKENIKAKNISSCRLTDMTIIVDGQTAEQDVTTVIHWGNSQPQGMSCLKWKVYWVKRPGGWRIKKADPPQQTIPGFGG